MSYSTVGSTFVEDAQTGVDANANTTTPSVDVSNAQFIRFQVTDNTGSHSTHIIRLQVSLDETVWYDTGTTVTGTGLSSTSARNVAKSFGCGGGTGSLGLLLGKLLLAFRCLGHFSLCKKPLTKGKSPK